MAEFKEAARYAYQLRAVSEHIGVPESGHFVTYRRGIGQTEQHKWHRISDADVSFCFICFHTFLNFLSLKIFQSPVTFVSGGN